MKPEYVLYDHSDCFHIINNILFNAQNFKHNKIRKLIFDNPSRTYIPYGDLHTMFNMLFSKSSYDTESRILRYPKGKNTFKRSTHYQILKLLPSLEYVFYEVYIGYDLKTHKCLMYPDKTLKLIRMFVEQGLRLTNIKMMPTDEEINEAINNQSINTDPLLLKICNGHLNTLSLHTTSNDIGIAGIKQDSGFYRFDEKVKY